MARIGPATYLTKLDDPERTAQIKAALVYESGNVTRAAWRLGISRPYLWYWLRRLKLGMFPRRVRASIHGRFDF